MRYLFCFLLLCFSLVFTYSQDIDNALRDKDAVHFPGSVDLTEFSTVDNSFISGADIQDLGTRNAYEMATLISSQVSWDGGSQLYIKNASTQIYVDGVKIRGSISLPKKAIGEVRIISGGGGQ